MRRGASDVGQSRLRGTEVHREHLQQSAPAARIVPAQNPDCLIEVDGGVNTTNAPMLFEAGADVLVAGNAVFKSDNPLQTIMDLKR